MMKHYSDGSTYILPFMLLSCTFPLLSPITCLLDYFYHVSNDQLGCGPPGIQRSVYIATSFYGCESSGIFLSLLAFR